MKRLMIVFLALLFTIFHISCENNENGDKDVVTSGDIKLTVDSTKITGALSSFPILIHLSSESGITKAELTQIFTVLQSDMNRKKISIKTNDRTECYVEIEKWDTANRKAWLWIKIPTLNSTSDTTLNLHYDVKMSDNNSYIGDTGDVPAQNVWDAYFFSVWHMAQDPSGEAPQVLESTFNMNNGTTEGNMTSSDLVNGKISNAIDFDGLDDSVAISPLWTASSQPNEITITAITYPRDTTGDIDEGPCIFYHGDYGEVMLRVHSQQLQMCAKLTNWIWYRAVSNVQDSNWYYVVGTWKKGDALKIYINNVLKNTVSVPFFDLNSAIDNPPRIGSRSDWGSSSYFFDGIIDELRVSTIIRSPNWINASYYSENDELITYVFVQK